VGACAEPENVVMNTGAWQQGSAKLLRAKWNRIRTYADLQEQLHRDLIAQNPGWIDANGDCPTCDSYDRRLAELITIFKSGTRDSLSQIT
jgi:hypothetical protein